MLRTKALSPLEGERVGSGGYIPNLFRIPAKVETQRMRGRGKVIAKGCESPELKNRNQEI